MSARRTFEGVGATMQAVETTLHLGELLAASGHPDDAPGAVAEAVELGRLRCAGCDAPA